MVKGIRVGPATGRRTIPSRYSRTPTRLRGSTAEPRGGALGCEGTWTAARSPSGAVLVAAPRACRRARTDTRCRRSSTRCTRCEDAAAARREIPAGGGAPPGVERSSSGRGGRAECTRRGGRRGESTSRSGPSAHGPDGEKSRSDHENSVDPSTLDARRAMDNDASGRRRWTARGQRRAARGRDGKGWGGRCPRPAHRRLGQRFALSTAAWTTPALPTNQAIRPLRARVAHIAHSPDRHRFEVCSHDNARTAGPAGFPPARALARGSAKEGEDAIEWTDATWNPVRGCTKISPGCKHCYAETFAERFRGVPGHPFEQGFDLRLGPSKLELPLRWRTPADRSSSTR